MKISKTTELVYIDELYEMGIISPYSRYFKKSKEKHRPFKEY